MSKSLNLSLPFSDHMTLCLVVITSLVQERYFCTQFISWDFVEIEKEKNALKYMHIGIKIEDWIQNLFHSKTPLKSTKNNSKRT